MGREQRPLLIHNTFMTKRETENILLLATLATAALLLLCMACTGCGSEDDKIIKQHYDPDIVLSVNEVHVNDVIQLWINWAPRDTSQAKQASLEAPSNQWHVSAGELFWLSPEPGETGQLQVMKQDGPVWWRAPAYPQPVYIDYGVFYPEVGITIDVLPAL